MKKLNSKGLTLVELLCVIVILGIFSTFAVVSLSSLIFKGKSVVLTEQEKTVQLACESYLQDHKEDLPKVVEESKNISLKQLRRTNYLKENITNSYKKSCMDNSYVRIYKYGQKDYSYTTYLYCGDDKVGDDNILFSPNVEIYFTDGDVNSTYDDAMLDKNKDIKAVFKIDGGVNTTTNSQILLYNYMYTINLITEDGSKELFNSGIQAAYKKKLVNFEILLSNYVEKDDIDKVQINISVKNITGGVKQVLMSTDTVLFKE